ncbi:thiolase family protein [Marinicrinis sediminis]|uniref:acetyl-CoA C-acyltransferase n=1 Tax=Marinicrinis sediminis TaxID=1652465 RepID=A0ABW5RFF1_9BACL
MRDQSREHPNDAVIVAMARTPVGKAKKGVFRHTRAEDLGKAVITGLLERAPFIQPEQIDDVILGCAMPEGQQGLNVARLIGLYAGLPVTVPSITINRFCASGLQSIAYAAGAIRLGEADVVLAGGVESMSHVPMTGFHLDPHPVMVAEHPERYMNMGHTAEEVAERFQLSREDQDRFAWSSHQKAAIAQQKGYFDDEIVSVDAEMRFDGDGTGQKATVERMRVYRDEGIRPETTLEALSRLKPVFRRGGTVTAGNASQMSDGAAGVFMMSRKKAEELKVQPLAVFRGYAVAGVEPELMGIGPVQAIPKVLQSNGLTVNEVDLYEINEAFASQCLHVIRELGLDEKKVNVNGGAIALGHPLGCTGAKLTISLIQELRRRGGGIGVVSMCIGGGMGAAGVFEVQAPHSKEASL